MSETARNLGAYRESIIENPEVILDDQDVMRALIAANEKSLGSNIVDLRGIAMERLEARLDRLEDTHRSVIAAAYENLAGTNQIHRAILDLLDPVDFADFVANLGGNVADILRVDRMRLLIETAADDAALCAPVEARLGHVLSFVPEGWIDRFTGGTRTRKVTLRQVSPASEEVYGASADWVSSEALLRLDFGPGRRPGLLVLGCEDPHQFRPNQGTDLLAFFAGVFERVMRRWLA
ncbi:MAG: DUF484 domain-containing protein [Alphaproteobacteria bacterium HGW-Alphaproteobacteria-2]|nr:MAG: DUF484 domain-containing protein [Alphaproteobacteria bacterium HGW-Alphaproteobacteria-2]